MSNIGQGRIWGWVKAMKPSARRARRRGVTLMEVMFAIGVVMIGLLGIAVLVPIAGKAAQDGSNYERAARAGLNAVRHFQMREMGRPAHWLFPDYTAVGTPTANNVAFCLDPRFVALNNQLNMPVADARRFFPYTPVSSNVPRMQRISLRNWPSTYTNSSLMSRELADEIFVALDDLNIDTPEDALSPALQVYYNQTPASPDKRQANGEFSWFATICPRNDGSAFPSPSNQDTYTLSIVIVQGRDNAMPLDGISERWAVIPSTPQVNGFYGAGLNGGEVALVERSLMYTIVGESNPVAPNPADLEVKRGQWVLLARNSPFGPIFHWYKVTEAAPDLEDSARLLGSGPPAGHSIRFVTLHGQDWRFDPNPAFQTAAIIMPGVVSVYEKTIRLENSSLWSQ